MSAPSKKSDTRTTELIGMDIDGQMYLWSKGEVRPVTAFEDYRHGSRRLIKSGHYVIHWQGHAITVHCGSVLDGRRWKVSVQFMCSRGPVLCMARAEVEAMLLGEVVRDPRAEERILQRLKELHEAVTVRHQAPHRRRIRMSRFRENPPLVYILLLGGFNKMASVSVSAAQSNSASVSQTSTATNNGAVSTTLANGSLSLYDPNDPLDFGNLSLINYQLTASSPVTTVDTNVMSHSGLNTGSLNNMGWIVPEDGSELQIGNLTGSGDITAVDGTVVIAGTGSTSETIGLVDNSNLYLGIAPGMRFLSPIDIDATSTIHFYNNPNEWASDLTSNSRNEAIGMTNPPADLIGGMAYVNSLTPGYQPEIIFQFAPGPGSVVAGVTIVDKPIIAAHT